ncbi:32141_t:CDS:1, partial [Racocetra persica]
SSSLHVTYPELPQYVPHVFQNSESKHSHHQCRPAQSSTSLVAAHDLSIVG